MIFLFFPEALEYTSGSPVGWGGLLDLVSGEPPQPSPAAQVPPHLLPSWPQIRSLVPKTCSREAWGQWKSDDPTSGAASSPDFTRASTGHWSHLGIQKKNGFAASWVVREHHGILDLGQIRSKSRASLVAQR